MRFAYVGNFEPAHSTENEIRKALLALGHDVITVQEGDAAILDGLVTDLIRPRAIDVVLWTRTKSLADRAGEAAQWKMLAEARRAVVPVVGYHLDRWWGLERETQIATDPFFRVDILCTADGGHDEWWQAAGVNHAWFPPAVSEFECGLGTHRPEFASDIAFVGSWQGYHPEWRHRDELVQFLKSTYGKRVRFWPEPSRPAVRGADLRDLYASAKVVVGDSCLVPKPDGSPMTHYCSDRIPETLGRGGILLHPSVEGVDSLYGPWYYNWKLGDWGLLKVLVDTIIDDGMTAGHDRTGQVEFIREHHTYTVRMRQLHALLTDAGVVG